MNCIKNYNFEELFFCAMFQQITDLQNRQY